MHPTLARSCYRLLSRNASHSEALPLFTDSFQLSEDLVPRYESDVKKILRNEFQKPVTNPEQGLQIFNILREVSERSMAFGYGEKIDYSIKYPGFLYSQSLYPGSRLKLHFFEERYRKLVKHAHEGNQRFVYMLTCKDDELQDNVGVLGWLQRCDMMPDGKANVEILMGPRVKIKNSDSEKFGEDSLKWLTVEELRDSAPKNEEDSIQIEELRLSIIGMLVKEWSRLKTANNALKRPQNMFKLLTYHYGGFPLDAENLSLWVCSWAFGVGKFEDRQYYLQSECTLERLKKVHGLLLSITKEHLEDKEKVVKISIKKRPTMAKPLRTPSKDKEKDSDLPSE